MVGDDNTLVHNIAVLVVVNDGHINANTSNTEWFKILKWELLTYLECEYYDSVATLLSHLMGFCNAVC